MPRLLFKMVIIFIFLISCNSSQKILERKTGDGGKVIVKKGIFSGIDYIFIEKSYNNKKVFKLFYDCECGIDNKIILRKEDWSQNKSVVNLIAVTDTTDVPRFFEELITSNRLRIPLRFVRISEEEIGLLEEAIDSVAKPCCKNPDKPIKKIIGFVVSNSN